MSQTLLNQDLLERLRLSARKKARQDKSRTYLQWLDQLCSEHGFTYTSLKRRIEELEAQALKESLAAEDRTWDGRLKQSRIWGTPPQPADWTFPLPVDSDTHIPWPNAFSESRLFTLTESAPRRALSGSVWRMDGREMFFEGEELRIVSDEILLMGLIMASQGVKCGAVVDCSLVDFERIMGCRLPDLGIPVPYAEIERTLWRMSNCRLTFDDFGFNGPILSYADARESPNKFSYAMNPAFANFYYPFLVFFNRIFI